MRKTILGNLCTGLFSALVAIAIFAGTHTAQADQFKYGNRVTQPGDMVPQSTAQSTFNFQPIFGAGLSIAGPIVQPSGSPTLNKTMVAGVATLNFTGFTYAPICQAIPEGSDASATANDYMVTTTTSCTYHSGDSADTRVVHFALPLGNPY